MNKKKTQVSKKHWIALFVISVISILLLSSLFFSSFGIVTAQWTTQNQIESFSVGNAEGEIYETLFIYIEQNILFKDEVNRMLQKKLQSFPFSIKILNHINETKNIENGSFLGITISEINTQYLPWSGELSYVIFYYFSDIGNTEYFPVLINLESMADKPPIIFNATQGPQFMNVGEIIVEASLEGFFSKPKMQQLSYHGIAAAIHDQLINY